ncbi:hypothetical protein BCV69DRAFT_301083 [Microstroma glucosiphilum]|uniref:Retrotransposon gag domain-containing protein n=1 Tax=Pseudomicrostroma glucosiphilum TaxID=1684307 RepID=A0A316TZK6_9BASI|nr:hypothetical protein BCV69DRAFT_301083 [Pseudomicrostroma glucosiphilum]PWN18602.1 hypothetical protein BCV69DRAFT_301083 [Pseudomicrostroma glucosiphilum]
MTGKNKNTPDEEEPVEGNSPPVEAPTPEPPAPTPVHPKTRAGKERAATSRPRSPQRPGSPQVDLSALVTMVQNLVQEVQNLKEQVAEQARLPESPQVFPSRESEAEGDEPGDISTDVLGRTRDRRLAQAGLSAPGAQGLQESQDPTSRGQDRPNFGHSHPGVRFDHRSTSRAESSPQGPTNNELPPQDARIATSAPPENRWAGRDPPPHWDRSSRQLSVPGSAGQWSDRGGPRGKSLIKPPETFSGDRPSERKEFIRTLEYMFMSDPGQYDLALPGADNLRIITTISYLTGQARVWATNLWDQVPRPASMLYWHDFTQVFAAIFFDPEEKERAKKKIQMLKQTGKLHRIYSYTIEFNSLHPLTGYDGLVLRDFYYKGLSSEMKDAVALNGLQIDTLQQLQNACTRQDQRLAEREQERKEEKREEERSFSGRGKFDKSDRTRTRGSSRHTPTTEKPVGNWNSDKRSEDRNKTPGADSRKDNGTGRPKIACYECGGDHLARNCPNRSNRAQGGRRSGVNVMVDREEQDDSEDSEYSDSETGSETSSDDRDDVSDQGNESGEN